MGFTIQGTLQCLRDISNWISDIDELYATSGYVFTIGGGAVSWRSCKQTILMRSTMEAELTALCSENGLSCHISI